MKTLLAALCAGLALASTASAQSNTRWTDPTGAWSIDFTSVRWGHAEGLPADGPVLLIAPAASPRDNETRLCFVELKTEALTADADPTAVQNRGAQMGAPEIAAAFPNVQITDPQITHAVIDGVAVMSVEGMTHANHLRGRAFATVSKSNANTWLFFCVSSPNMPAVREAEVEAILGSLHFGSTAVTSAAQAPASPVNGPYVLGQPAPDQAAQLADMIALYDDICFSKFPDDHAVTQAMEARHATPMTHAEIQSMLHDDPGTGWFIDGPTGRFSVTIERPPYHACGVRALTVAGGFANMQPYQDFEAQKLNGRTGERIGPMRLPVRGTISLAQGVSLPNGDHRVENLLVFQTTPDVPDPAAQHLGTEMRLVRQLATRQ